MTRYGTSLLSMCFSVLFGRQKAQELCKVGFSNDLLITGIPHHRSHSTWPRCTPEEPDWRVGHTGSRTVITTSGHGSSWFQYSRFTKRWVDLKIQEGQDPDYGETIPPVPNDRQTEFCANCWAAAGRWLLITGMNLIFGWFAARLWLVSGWPCLKSDYYPRASLYPQQIPQH